MASREDLVASLAYGLDKLAFSYFVVYRARLETAYVLIDLDLCQKKTFETMEMLTYQWLYLRAGFQAHHVVKSIQSAKTLW